MNQSPEALLLVESQISLQFAFDISDSMNYGTPPGIDVLNKALAVLPSTIESSPGNFLVSLTAFGSGKATVVHKFATHEKLKIQPFSAAGDTPLGKAVDLQIEIYEELVKESRACGLRMNRPVFAFLTDGKPNGNWEQSAQRLRALQAAGNKGRIVVLFGLPQGCDPSIISKFVLNPSEQIVPLSIASIADFLRITSRYSASMSALGTPSQVLRELEATTKKINATYDQDDQLPQRKWNEPATRMRGSQQFGLTPQERREGDHEILPGDFL